jgi:hypothetical protein
MAVIAEADPNYTLDQLNEFVADREDNLDGPLTAIGHGNGKTRITIDDQDPAGTPPKHSLITLGGIPAGARQIGTGQVYIAGTLKNATAYSPA